MCCEKIYIVLKFVKNMRQRDIGLTLFLISLVLYLYHPLSVGDWVTQISLAGIIIGFVLMVSRECAVGKEYC